MEKTFVLHKESGLSVSKDGEIYVPKSGKHPAHYTYGYKRKDGYREVRYKGKPYSVHRLVAETYIPNPENKPEIDHIIPVSMGGTNDVSNLRWSTRSENNNNPLSRQNLSEAMTEAMKGNTNCPKKPVVGTNKKTGYTVEFESATDAWLTLNIARESITACCKGRIKSAGGYEWHYKQNPLEEIYSPDIKPSLEEFFKALDDFMMEQ